MMKGHPTNPHTCDPQTCAARHEALSSLAADTATKPGEKSIRDRLTRIETRLSIVLGLLTPIAIHIIIQALPQAHTATATARTAARAVAHWLTALLA